MQKKISEFEKMVKKVNRDLETPICVSEGGDGEVDVLERFSDEKGWGYICPKCGTKCYTRSVGYEGWVCECVDCDLLFDED